MVQSELPKLDLTKIEYPTDRLTIKDLRKRSPRGFDVEPTDPLEIAYDCRPLPRKSLDGVIAATLDSERILAEMAFRAALGFPGGEDRRMGGRETIFENLGNDYVNLGIARGRHEADELLRGIEAQAAAQARQVGAPPIRR